MIEIKNFTFLHSTPNLSWLFQQNMAGTLLGVMVKQLHFCTFSGQISPKKWHETIFMVSGEFFCFLKCYICVHACMHACATVHADMHAFVLTYRRTNDRGFSLKTQS